MTLDLSFLSIPLGSMPTPARPVDVYNILSDGWHETRVDMTLQFFLDPNERHGLGSLVIDALPIKQFLEARRRAGSLIRDRSRRLMPLIAAGLEDAGRPWRNRNRHA